MRYKKLVSSYNDGFIDYCPYCNEELTTYDVKYEDKKFKLQINNQRHVRLFNDTEFISIPYYKIKQVIWHYRDKSIEFNTGKFMMDLTFKSSKCKIIFEKLTSVLNLFAQQLADRHGPHDTEQPFPPKTEEL